MTLKNIEAAINVKQVRYSLLWDVTRHLGSYKGDIRSSGMLRGILVVSYKGDIRSSGMLRGILVVTSEIFALLRCYAASW